MPQKRNTVRYHSAGLFVTDRAKDNPDEDSVYFVNRVQSVDFSVAVNRENLKEIGSEDFIDRKIVSEPEINLNFNYFVTDGYEENIIGLNVYPKHQEYTDYYGTRDVDEDFSKRGTIYNNIRENKDFFLAVGAEEFDVLRNLTGEYGTSQYDIAGFGNCFITNYSVSASVGSFAEATVGVKASNITYSCNNDYSVVKVLQERASVLKDNEVTEENFFDFIQLENEGNINLERDGTNYTKYFDSIERPSLDLKNKGARIENHGLIFEPIVYNGVAAAISPGGITLKVRSMDHGGPTLDNDEENIDDYCFEPIASVQSFNLSIPFERENLLGFESMHAYGRKMKYPQLGTIEMEMFTTAFKNGRFENIFCDDGVYDMQIDLANNCQLRCVKSAERDKYLRYTIRDAKLESYSYNLNIGGNGTVNCSFSFPLSPSFGMVVSGSYMNTKSSPCGPSELMSPRSLDVNNISPLGDQGSPKDLTITRL